MQGKGGGGGDIIASPHVPRQMDQQNCEQPRGKDTPGYWDSKFYDQYLRRYEQFYEK